MNDDLWSAMPAVDERSRRAVEEASKLIGDKVQGVGIGATEDGDPCVVVYVDAARAASASLPERIEGLPVVVQPGDAFFAEGPG